jgi:hypothetical protein
MPTRFDHAVIAVRDLSSAITQFQRLGFDARPGGRHTGLGTYNGLIRFGLDYVELLGVYDEAEARAANASGLTILDALRGRDIALVGYALATTQIEQEAQHLKGVGGELPVLKPMQRARPDGHMLTWRILSLGGGITWGRPWPFLIQWDTPDEQRLQVDLPGTHSNGAIAWTRIAVATCDLEGTLDIYQNQLGLALIRRDVDEIQAAQRAVFRIGQGTIDLVASHGEGPVQQILSEKGEGPYALTFAVKNLEQTRAFLQRQHIGFTLKVAEVETLVLDPSASFGIDISFVEQHPSSEG